MSDDAMVVIARNGNQTPNSYHRRGGCSRLASAKNPDTVSLDAALRAGREPCKWCYGEVDLSGCDHSHLRSLRQAAEGNG